MGREKRGKNDCGLHIIITYVNVRVTFLLHQKNKGGKSRKTKGKTKRPKMKMGVQERKKEKKRERTKRKEPKKGGERGK